MLLRLKKDELLKRRDRFCFITFNTRGESLPYDCAYIINKADGPCLVAYMKRKGWEPMLRDAREWDSIISAYSYYSGVDSIPRILPDEFAWDFNAQERALMLEGRRKK